MIKSSAYLIVAGAVMAMGVTAASAQYSPSAIPEQYSGPPEPFLWTGLPAGQARYLINVDYRDDLNSLREDGLRLRAEDGGSLTEAHKSMLQVKLDKLRTRYLRALHNASMY